MDLWDWPLLLRGFESPNSITRQLAREAHENLLNHGLFEYRELRVEGG
jgi:hypothetical protein